MLKYSDDVYANAIFKTIGKEEDSEGSYTGGAEAVHQVLADHFGTLFRHTELKDGSGLSTENQISPEQLVELYHEMYYDPNLRAAFIHSLAISGQSGTLVYRMTDPLLRGHVYAKTGTFEHDQGGVSNLAGYILIPGYEPVAFAIMVNNANNISQAQGFQDAIVRLVAKELVAEGG
jgi:D-alanyl-D-alanine carboxypeptidase/D-alanyl-D-alanine-endopeptidase (penicillin-binding protein 4)